MKSPSAVSPTSWHWSPTQIWPSQTWPTEAEKPGRVHE